MLKRKKTINIFLLFYQTLFGLMAQQDFKVVKCRIINTKMISLKKDRNKLKLGRWIKVLWAILKNVIICISICQFKLYFLPFKYNLKSYLGNNEKWLQILKMYYFMGFGPKPVLE